MAVPGIVGILGGGIALLAPWIITKVILALGMAYFLYQGMDVLFESAENAILGYFGQLPADLYNYLLMCGAGEAVTILISALATKILLTGFQAGAKTVLGYKVG